MTLFVGFRDIARPIIAKEPVLNTLNLAGNICPATAENLAKAASQLAAGGLVALPTETVYGLAADARNDSAVRRIYAAKGRPGHNPLICHIFSLDLLEELAYITPLARRLAAQFWPGPLTLVLERRANWISPQALANLPTIAIRFPKAEWTKAFQAAGFEGPIVMPSANRSGHISPTTAQHVSEDLGPKVDMIVDDGPCPGGIESTVIRVKNDQAILLRPGSVTPDDLSPFVKTLHRPEPQSAPIAPGMLKSHYAPKARVRLCAHDRCPGEAYLGFGHSPVAADLNLSPSGDLHEAARNLYDYLRRLDHVDTIAIAPIPKSGIGAAINDRLSRAAADKGEALS